jgi:hypothetical protein
MQRFNKSAHAPVGTAFLLVLGLAILPISLRFAGIQVTINPKISGAMDAWEQVSEAFAASFHPGLSADLSVNQEQDKDQQNGTENCVEPESHYACRGELEEESDPIGDISQVEVPKATCTRRVGPNRAKRIAASAPPVASIVVAGSVMKHLALDAVNALSFTAEHRIEQRKTQQFQKKSEFLKKEFLEKIDTELFKNGLQVTPSAKNITLPKNLKVLVRVKKPASALGQATAQCKVFSAMALERRRQCDRAALISEPVVNPDHSEF